MADVLVEVNEAMKQEKMEKLWQQYGGFFIGFLTIIILGTAANAGYKSWITAKNTAQTNLFLETRAKENYTADDLTAILPDLDNGLRGIIGIQAAGIALEQGDTSKALKIYNDLTQDTLIDPALSQLASYMIITLSSEMNDEERLSALKIITSNTQNPWRYHAVLDTALLEAQANNYTEARANLAIILKETAIPQTLKQKAQSLDILYNLKEKI